MRAFQTLRSQFVAVVAAAVILSNLSVIAILEIGREGDLQTARITAAVDRIAAVFRYVMSIPHEQRAAAVAALSGNLFHYSILPSPPPLQFSSSAHPFINSINATLNPTALRPRWFLMVSRHSPRATPSSPALA